MIDINKNYQTQEGHPVILLTTQARNPIYPVIGYIGNSDKVSMWTREGIFEHSEYQRLNLIEIKPTVTGYLNVYPNILSEFLHLTREAADTSARNAFSDRIACIKITYQEGQFDQ